MRQTDGAAGLDALGAPNGVTHVGCWAHARRRFVQAVRLGDSRAGPYLAQLDRLFRLDARARRIVAAAPIHADRVARWRVRFSAPLAEALFARAATAGLTLPPKSALGQAVGSLLAQRAPLTRCVTTPGARLDNNAVEHAIRPVKLGAKHWLFVGHPEAGPRLAGPRARRRAQRDELTRRPRLRRAHVNPSQLNAYARTARFPRRDRATPRARPPTATRVGPNRGAVARRGTAPRCGAFTHRARRSRRR